MQLLSVSLKTQVWTRASTVQLKRELEFCLVWTALYLERGYDAGFHNWWVLPGTTHRVDPGGTLKSKVDFRGKWHRDAEASLIRDFHRDNPAESSLGGSVVFLPVLPRQVPYFLLLSCVYSIYSPLVTWHLLVCHPWCSIGLLCQ